VPNLFVRSRLVCRPPCCGWLDALGSAWPLLCCCSSARADRGGRANNANEDKDVFDTTGTQCDSYVPGKYTCPTFGTLFAASFHTYKIVWTPRWIAWMIDSTLYRNSTNAPWRPVTMRPLLRTNVGTAASTAVLPDAVAYIRRIRYTPLNWAGSTNVVNDALYSPSMTAKYGSLLQSSSGTLQLSTAAATSVAARTGRRRLHEVRRLAGPRPSAAAHRVLSRVCFR